MESMGTGLISPTSLCQRDLARVAAPLKVLPQGCVVYLALRSVSKMLCGTLCATMNASACAETSVDNCVAYTSHLCNANDVSMVAHALLCNALGLVGRRGIRAKSHMFGTLAPLVLYQ